MKSLGLSSGMRWVGISDEWDVPGGVATPGTLSHRPGVLRRPGVDPGVPPQYANLIDHFILNT